MYDFLDNGDMAVVDVRIGNHVDELARNKAADLGQHVHQNRVLHHILVVCSQHVLGPLVQNRIERVAADVECHAVGARIQCHLT